MKSLSTEHHVSTSRAAFFGSHGIYSVCRRQTPPPTPTPSKRIIQSLTTASRKPPAPPPPTAAPRGSIPALTMSAALTRSWASQELTPTRLVCRRRRRRRVTAGYYPDFNPARPVFLRDLGPPHQHADGRRVPLPHRQLRRLGHRRWLRHGLVCLSNARLRRHVCFCYCADAAFGFPPATACSTGITWSAPMMAPTSLSTSTAMLIGTQAHRRLSGQSRQPARHRPAR